MSQNKTNVPNTDVDSDVLTDGIWVNDNGHVEGSVYVCDSANGYDVVGVVDSYDYDDHGGTKTNHVPRAVLTKPDHIIKEITDHDTEHAHEAIERAANSAEWLYENAEDFC